MFTVVVPFTVTLPGLNGGIVVLEMPLNSSVAPEVVPSVSEVGGH